MNMKMHFFLAELTLNLIAIDPILNVKPLFRNDILKIISLSRQIFLELSTWNKIRKPKSLKNSTPDFTVYMLNVYITNYPIIF